MLVSVFAGYLTCFVLNVITFSFSKHSTVTKQISILAAQSTTSKLNKCFEQIAKQTLHQAKPPHQNGLEIMKIASTMKKMFNLH